MRSNPREMPCSTTNAYKFSFPVSHYKVRQNTSRLETTILAYSQNFVADLHKFLLVISRSCTGDSVFPLLDTTITVKTEKIRALHNLQT